MARRKAQTYGSAILADHGGRLSARQWWRFLRTAGRAFALSAPRSRTDESRRYGDSVWIGQRVVSQLLAGPHSGPGRSPDAARVNMLRA